MYNLWREKEISLFKKKYSITSNKVLLKMFPGRSLKSLEMQAHKLGLNKSHTLYEKVMKKVGEDKMVRKNPLRKYVGKDRIIGRPIRLNVQELKKKKGKKYAEVLFIGDWHYGAKECDIEKIIDNLNYCYDHNIYVFLMGDLIDAGIKTSVGASMYNQTANPQAQLEYVEQLLQPLAKKKLILGILEGNHELRIEKDTGVSVTKIWARWLNIPYLGSACWSLFKIGKQSYKIYALHGSSGAKFIYTKLKTIVDISHSFNADLMVMGHVHELSHDSQTVQDIDKSSKQVIERKKFILLTGHYLAYDSSYAQRKGFPISKLGSPKVKFFSDHFDIHISF